MYCIWRSGCRSAYPNAAKAFIRQLYNPASPLYHQYLTTEQFTERFGPSVDDYQAVIDFAKASGFTVARTDPHRLLVDVDARAADVESAFQVKLFDYQHPMEARRFYAPDVEPSVPSGIKIVDISGLTSYPRPHSNSHIGGLGGRAATPVPNGGSIPGGQYIGNDFRAAYVPGCPLTGAGQNVALVQFDGYYPSDITRYETLAGLPAITLTNILLDGFSGVPTTGTLSGNGEVSLDIEMVNSMAPGIAKLFLYEGNPNNFIPNDVLQQIYTDDNSKQISCSWGWSGGPTGTTDNIFIEMAGHGQSFFVASGDSDAYPGSSADSATQFGTPAESAYVTSVGGTTLSTAGPTNNWTSEVVWNWYTELGSAYNGVGSSGGYSAYYSIPTWQQGVSSNNLGSTTGRNFPDVAMAGDHVFVAYGNGTTNWFGGTSCAAPLWAGFTALVNQQGAAKGESTVGFLNPALYTIGTGTSYSACFHDITSGNNEWSNSPSAYTALTGYDLCTGWGSPTGTNLINALVGPLTNAALVVDGAIVSGGNGNGVIDADECNLLNVIVQNIGAATATSVNATLTTSTTGVTITQPTATYSSVAPGAIATNTTSFQISTSPSFVCGTPVNLTLAVSFAGGSNTLTFALPTCTSCTALQINGGLTVSSPTQTGRLTRNYVVSTCSSPKTCPGYLTNTGAYRYEAHPFTNTTSGTICVNVTLTTPCAGQSSTGLFTAAYLGNFNPQSLCSDYLADQGGILTTSGSYSFSVPADTNFTVVVNDVGAGSYCSSYTLTVSGLPCYVDGGGACAGVSANFSGTPTNGVAPLAVTFTDTSTGSITNRFWNFGDGGTTNVNTNDVVYTYNTAGVYTVTEIVTGPGGSSTNIQPNYIVVLTPFQGWQIQYFGNTNNPNAAPTADADGTGEDNLFKFVAGLDPTNPASVFLLTIITDTNQPNAQDLRFLPLASGRTYTPQFSTDLVNGVWFPLTTSTGPVTNGNQISVTDTNPLSPLEFYRISISLP
jgi:PKD repeat protein